MAVSVNDSFVTEKASVYANLCELSKAKWNWNGAAWILEANQKNLAKYQELWNQMSQKGYVVLNFWDDTQGTGYAGTLFYNYIEGRSVIANRGTDGFLADDSAAVSSIAAGNVPAEQFRSMVEFITYCQQNDQIHLDTFDVIGHSLGGCLAQIAKATYPSEVRDVYIHRWGQVLNYQYWHERGHG